MAVVVLEHIDLDGARSKGIELMTQSVRKALAETRAARHNNVGEHLARQVDRHGLDGLRHHTEQVEELRRYRTAHACGCR